MSDHLPVSLMFSINAPVSSSQTIDKNIQLNFLKSTKQLVLNFRDVQRAKINIYDLTGSCLYQDIFDSQNHIEIQLSFLPKGLYIVDCLLQNERINHKFIVE
jgi:hypothetical protein